MNKISMKHMNSFFLSATAAALVFTALLTQAEEKAHGHKKDILHLFLQKKMANDGVVADASGKAEIHEDMQSKGNQQDVHIEVKNLGANTGYSLFAVINGDTNSTSIADFTTDDKGKASLEFRDKGKSKNDGKGHSKGPLPAALNPVSGIRELTIVDTNAQTVLTADLTSPDKLEYVVKRDLSTGSIEASLEIKGKANKAEVRLEASGLSANTEYSLALNGTVAQTGTTDENGKLKISSELDHPLDILALQSVALMDSTGNVVVSTTLP
jgi:hypothetical protein